MAISQDQIRQVREATDLVALIQETVVLNQKGRLFWGCCPIHNEKTPSFKVDPGMQNWHCFGCGKGGDAFSFLMETENMEFIEAVRFLADRARIELEETGQRGPSRNEKERAFAACEEAKKFYHNELMRSKAAEAAEARAYLKRRGFSGATAKEWQLGFAPGHGQLVRHLTRLGFTREELIMANLAYASQRNNQLTDRFYGRLMFPVHELQGRSCAFGGRVLGEGEPKYLNTSDTPIFHKSNNMYGIEKAKKHIVAAGCAIVVEGYTDVIALHEAGIQNVVATLGTALTAQHVKLLARFAKKIVYLFDGDAAGQKAADRAAEFIDWNSAVESSRNPIELTVCVLPGGQDPAEFVQDPAGGAAKLQEIIAAAQPLIEFSILRALARHDTTKSANKVRAMEEALKIILPLRGSVTAQDYVNLVADGLGLEYTSVAQAFAQLKAPAAARREQTEEPPAQAAPAATDAAAKILEADARAQQAEFTLLAYFVQCPALLANKALLKGVARVQFSSAQASAMAGALLAIPHTATSAQVMDAFSAVEPAAPALLAATVVQDLQVAEATSRAQTLVKSFQKKSLEQHIARLQARLASHTLPEAEFDEVFAQVSTLQKELLDLTRS